jgi:hypothetical protein
MDRPATGIEQGAVLHDPGVQGIHVETGADGSLDQGYLLGADEVVNQLTTPPQKGLSRHRSLVDGLGDAQSSVCAKRRRSTVDSMPNFFLPLRSSSGSNRTRREWHSTKR